MRFNVNNYVRVKLTDIGRDALRKEHENLYRLFDKVPEYLPPKEDADGWSEWQLWDLMNKLGPHCRNGAHVPFSTEIEIVTGGTK